MARSKSDSEYFTKIPNLQRFQIASLHHLKTTPKEKRTLSARTSPNPSSILLLRKIGLQSTCKTRTATRSVTRTSTPPPSANAKSVELKLSVLLRLGTSSLERVIATPAKARTNGETRLLPLNLYCGPPSRLKMRT